MSNGTKMSGSETWPWRSIPDEIRSFFLLKSSAIGEVEHFLVSIPAIASVKRSDFYDNVTVVKVRPPGGPWKPFAGCRRFLERRATEFRSLKSPLVDFLAKPNPAMPATLSRLGFSVVNDPLIYIGVYSNSYKSGCSQT